MTCEQGLLRLLWGGGRSWSATALVTLIDSFDSRKKSMRKEMRNGANASVYWSRDTSKSRNVFIELRWKYTTYKPCVSARTKRIRIHKAKTYTSKLYFKSVC